MARPRHSPFTIHRSPFTIRRLVLNYITNEEVAVTGSTSRWLLVGWMVLLLAGCAPIQPQPAGGEQAGATPAPTVNGLTLSETHAITQENTMTLTVPSANPVVKQAVEDLAGRLALSPDQITLVSAEAVVWPDAGLGCPQPGMAYIQIMQDGMKIILSAGGQEYHYHSGEGRPPFLCENPA
jgi:hypothetical protein